MKTIAISAFKARCLILLEDVARTGTPLLVTKRGRPLARVSASGNSDATDPQATLRGSVEIVGDVIEPVFPPGSWNAARGVLLSQERKATHRRRAGSSARRPRTRRRT